MVGLATGAAAVAFVLARLLVAARGDVSRFVVAGSEFVNRSTVSPRIHVFDSAGYDGQFYWRIAVEPSDHELSASHGVRIDQSIRLTRVTYPLLAWAGSLGRAGAVVWTLVGVNVVGFGLLAGLAAALARDHDLSGWTGLGVAASSGLVMSMSRDLCEIVMIAALVAGILALSRGRPLLAGLAFAVAVLTHEQSVLVVAVYGVHRIWTMVRERSAPSTADVAWALPGVGFVGCQLLYGHLLGRIPLFAFGGKNLTAPFAAIVSELHRYVTGSIPKQSILFLPELLLVVITSIVAIRSRASVPPAERWLLWALLATAALGACLSSNVWSAPSELRQVVVVPTLAWIVMIVARRRMPLWIVGSTGAVWLLVVGLRVVAI